MRAFLFSLMSLALLGGTSLAQTAPILPKNSLIDVAQSVISRNPFSGDPLLEAGGCDKVLRNAGYEPSNDNCAVLRSLMIGLRTTGND